MDGGGGGVETGVEREGRNERGRESQWKKMWTSNCQGL